MSFDELDRTELSYILTEVEEDTRTTIYGTDEEVHFYQVDWSEPSKYPDGVEYSEDAEIIENDIKLMLEQFDFEETQTNSRMEGPIFSNEDEPGTTLIISDSNSRFEYETNQLIDELNQPLPEIFHRYYPERS